MKSIVYISRDSKTSKGATGRWGNHLTERCTGRFYPGLSGTSPEAFPHEGTLEPRSITQPAGASAVLKPDKPAMAVNPGAAEARCPTSLPFPGDRF